jgi:polyphosphate kinase 2 (PPK2 family)
MDSGLKDYRVTEGDEVNLKKWSTNIDPLFKSEEKYRALLADRAGQMQELQQRLYASNRYSVLVIFQAMDEGSIRALSGASALNLSTKSGLAMNRRPNEIRSA